MIPWRNRITPSSPPISRIRTDRRKPVSGRASIFPTPFSAINGSVAFAHAGHVPDIDESHPAEAPEARQGRPRIHRRGCRPESRRRGDLLRRQPPQTTVISISFTPTCRSIPKYTPTAMDCGAAGYAREESDRRAFWCCFQIMRRNIGSWTRLINHSIVLIPSGALFIICYVCRV